MKVHGFPDTRLTPLAVLVAIGLLNLSGCATREFVQQEVSGVNSRIDALQGLLKDANQRIDGNGVRLNYAETHLDRAEQTASVLGRRIDDTLAGLAGANQRLDGLGGELAAAHGRIAANEVEIARAHQRVDVAESRILAESQRVEGALASLARTESRLGAAESELRTLSSARVVEGIPAAPVEAVTSMPEPAVASPVVATTALATANGRLDELAALITSASQRIDANAEALDKAAVRIDGVASRLEDVRRRGEAGEQALAATNQRLEQARGEIAATKQATVVQAEAISAVDQRVDRLSGQLDAAASSASVKEHLDGLGASVMGVVAQLTRTDSQVAAVEQRLGALQTTVDAGSARLDETDGRLNQAVAALQEQATATAAVSATAREALDRAIAAGRLAEGKLVYETVLSEAMATFEPGMALLPNAGKAALTDFANRLLAENRNVYIEIQGYTDNVGTPAGNKRLGRARAEAARDFLHDSCGLPLQRMTVVSYGEARAVADNTTPEGRAQNRRIVLVVLR